MLLYLEAHKNAFSPEELSILVGAFDKAWQALSQHHNWNPEGAREILAKRIFERAQAGDLDQERLARDAMDHVAVALLNASRQEPKQPEGSSG